MAGEIISCRFNEHEANNIRKIAEEMETSYSDLVRQLLRNKIGTEPMFLVPCWVIDAAYQTVDIDGKKELDEMRSTPLYYGKG